MPRRPAAPTPVTPVVAAGLASVLALGCSSGDPVDPSAPTNVENTYVLATVTVLDSRADPQFFECESREPVNAGRTFELRGDVATAGVRNPNNWENPGDPGSPAPLQVRVTASDLTQQIGVSFEFDIQDQFDPGGSAALTTSSSRENALFVDLDLTCENVNREGVQESRFRILDAASGSLTLTEFSTDPDTGQVLVAMPGPGNQFESSGIMGGSFSFTAQNDQTTAGGDFMGEVLVEGCFRLPIPLGMPGSEPIGGERQVPVDPTPPSPECTP